jgi:uncharacterized protein
MHALVAVAISLVLQAGQSNALRWVQNPRTTSGSWVADPAGHLSAATRATLDSMISALESETTTEIAVVVIDSLDGLEPSQAALTLHRRWGVGKRDRHNGILFLWSPALRKTHVSIGDGLEGVLTDSRTGRIQDEHVIPLFRENRFDEGMIAGVTALGAAARGETYSDLPRALLRPPSESDARRGPPAAVLWGLGGVAGVPILWAAIAAYRRRRPRPCPKGHGPMRRLSEKDDDAMLSREALLEETLESMDYDVWVCGQCDANLVLPYKRFTFKYSECPKCKRRTCETKTKTLRAATRSSTGRKRITRTCKNCSFTDSREEVIPIITSSSSSGGSGGGGGGGSSFGGGSSGGGGAGRSY